MAWTCQPPTPTPPSAAAPPALERPPTYPHLRKNSAACGGVYLPTPLGSEGKSVSVGIPMEKECSPVLTLHDFSVKSRALQVRWPCCHAADFCPCAGHAAGARLICAPPPPGARGWIGGLRIQPASVWVRESLIGQTTTYHETASLARHSRSSPPSRPLRSTLVAREH